MLCDAKKAMNIIRAERIAQNVTATRLARMIGMDKSTLSRKESGGRGLTYTDFQKMVNALNIDIRRFYENTV